MNGGVDITLDRVLWRTAGREWGYRFVMCPPFVRNAYDFHVAVFGDMAVGVQEEPRGGLLTCDGRDVPYVATAFRDSTRVDSVSRPIVHYMTWFPPANSITDGKLVLAVDWGAQLVSQLGEAWEQIYSAATPASEACDALLSRSVLIRITQPREIDCGRRVALKKNKPVTARPKALTPRMSRAVVIVGALLVAGAALVLFMSGLIHRQTR